jgi:tripartite-type tricarboxylate transporter receptor subunit TctC
VTYAKLRLSVLAAAAAGCLFATAESRAAATPDFPTKPVRFVLGPAPDLLPRLLSQKLSEHWKQQLVIDQRPGAGGVLAGDTVAKAPADGYTWLMSAGSFVIIDKLYPKVPYDFNRDLTPVTLMATVPYIVVLHPSVQAKSLRELVQLAQSRPGQLNYASAGTGTSTHIVTEIFKSAAKVDITHVAYKGVVAAVADVLAGQVQLTFSVAQAAVPHVQTGKLRAIATTSAKRSSVLPDVPTMTEAGYRDVDVVGWNGVHVPALTPRAVIDRINRDINNVLPELNERLIAAGFEPTRTTVEAFDAFVKKDVSRYTKVIRESNIRLD